MPDVSFFEYMDNIGILKNCGLNDIKSVITYLEDHHQFETASRVRSWKRFFDISVKEEFDETCLSEPIPNFDPYVVESFLEDDHELDDGWVHEWELSPEYIDYDDGSL